MEFDAVLLERVNLFHAASCYVDLHGGVGCGGEGREGGGEGNFIHK